MQDNNTKPHSLTILCIYDNVNVMKVLSRYQPVLKLDIF
jgi:hypothetical protein